jgi:hypothetical protein
MPNTMFRTLTLYALLRNKLALKNLFKRRWELQYLLHPPTLPKVSRLTTVHICKETLTIGMCPPKLGTKSVCYTVSTAACYPELLAHLRSQKTLHILDSSSPQSCVLLVVGIIFLPLLLGVASVNIHP